MLGDKIKNLRKGMNLTHLEKKRELLSKNLPMQLMSFNQQ